MAAGLMTQAQERGDEDLAQIFKLSQAGTVISSRQYPYPAEDPMQVHKPGFHLFSDY